MHSKSCWGSHSICDLIWDPAKVIHSMYYKHCSAQPFGQEKNGLVSGRLASISRKTKNLIQYSTLHFNPEFSIQFRMYFHSNNLRSRGKNPWSKPWFNILLQPQSNVDARTHCLYLNLNDQKTRHFYWCIPGMLETHTIPK